MTLPPFIPAWSDLRPFAGDAWLIVSISAVLLIPFVVRKAHAVSAVVALVGLGMGLISLLLIGPHSAGASAAFRPMLVCDGVAWFWKLILFLFTIGVVLMWLSTARNSVREGDAPEFFTLLLGATLGMSLMGSASNFLMLFMSVELASLPSYVLAGFRKTNRASAEAALKYVLFGAVASSVMVYGISIVYGLYGTLRLYSDDTPAGHIAGVAELVAAAPGGPLLAVALAGLLAGIGFKICAVPFHFWCPDVFEGAGVDVAAFLSVASKGAGLVLLLRLAMAFASAQHFAPTGGLVAASIVIGVLGAVTATVANTAAYTQENIKRLLAYSSIAHAGYMLCVISLLFRRGSIAYPAGAVSQALLLYLAVYLFMNLGAFTVAGLVYARTGSEEIAGYAGLGARAPLLAGCMALFLFSLIGLPPMAGFAAKLNVMMVLASGGKGWWVLVAIIGVNTVLSLYYYARVLKSMYLTDSQAPVLRANSLGVGICVACAAMLLLMLIGLSPLQKLTARYGRLLSAAHGSATSASAAR